MYERHRQIKSDLLCGKERRFDNNKLWGKPSPKERLAFRQTFRDQEFNAGEGGKIYATFSFFFFTKEKKKRRACGNIFCANKIKKKQKKNTRWFEATTRVVFSSSPLSFI